VAKEEKDKDGKLQKGGNEMKEKIKREMKEKINYNDFVEQNNNHDKDKGRDKNPLKDKDFGEEIHKALRFLNMSISNNLLKKWYEHVRTNLECAKRERLEFEYYHRDAPTLIPFILPHEFLFLLCNSLNRIDTVNREHKLNFDCKFGDIYQWEIADGKPMRDM